MKDKCVYMSVKCCPPASSGAQLRYTGSASRGCLHTALFLLLPEACLLWRVQLTTGPCAVRSALPTVSHSIEGGRAAAAGGTTAARQAGGHASSIGWSMSSPVIPLRGQPNADPGLPDPSQDLAHVPVSVHVYVALWVSASVCVCVCLCPGCVHNRVHPHAAL